MHKDIVQFAIEETRIPSENLDLLEILMKSWIENAKSLLPRQIFYLQKWAPAETVWIENRTIPLQLDSGYKKLTRYSN